MTYHNKNLNIPNALTVLRMILIIPFVIFYVNKQYIPAVVVLIISGITDALDGFVARHFNQFTELGKMLDPLSDKLTQGSVALCLAIQYPILLPFFLVFIIKEVGMVIAALVLIKKRKKPCGSKWYGKIATILFYISFVTIVAMRIWNIDNMTLTVVLLSITAFFMIYALIRYFVIFLSILRSDDPENHLDINEVMDKQITSDRKD
ncbi:CDP-alcohol phosphatidyltransferase family protein [Caproicibacterium sp. BJN0003]|uniref:CDP-alcohol phosphatidyltransferase family protein n=1 Tax=Caproicibacterium sp. BJN0003 TaxID=2994078 RepID=UPI00224FAAC7|nr:CDP-alcohol phosphatidyltransferase family protein [Caproicibacterium sp. BJN0003]UZT83023.1 CDP-alcohol phosphatidyltransferase family protein [Caproicibacterium sp. BJN0003]